MKWEDYSKDQESDQDMEPLEVDELDNDEINAAEAGFLKGYEESDEYCSNES